MPATVWLKWDFENLIVRILVNLKSVLLVSILIKQGDCLILI